MNRYLLGTILSLFALPFAGQAQAQHGPSYGGHSHGWQGGSHYSGPGYAYSSPGSYRSYAPGFSGPTYSSLRFGGGGHYDYVPGHFDRHRGHYDYVPPHVDYHRGGGRYEVVPGPFGSGYISPYRHRD